MPSYLTDPPQTVYLILAAVVVVTGALLARYQDRRRLVPFAVAVAVLVGLYLIDRQNESVREQGVRQVKAMAQAVNDRNRDAFVENLADPLEYRGGGQPRSLTREEFRHAGFWDLVHRHNVRVAAWDFSQEDTRQLDENTVEVGFLAKAEGEGRQVPMYFRATFTRQPDGKVKMTRLASFDAVQRTGEPKSIAASPFSSSP